ncbi:hypothetical protein T484DRAFT_1816668 [Baffinella frigidus]|nr:hypothetical protein T484DRAFT_1816668 [Cryptophyta sp. CCMP2293]
MPSSLLLNRVQGWRAGLFDRPAGEEPFEALVQTICAACSGTGLLERPAGAEALDALVKTISAACSGTCCEPPLGLTA